MSKAKEWADRLNGRQYRGELTRSEGDQANADRVLIVYGASDDLTEFDGILWDEAGAYNGATLAIRFCRRKGVWGLFQDEEDIAGSAIKINAEWAPDGDYGVSWRITSNVPHHVFKIKEGDDIYGYGCVIDESDLFATNCSP